MDPLEALVLETETSLLLVAEARRRGHGCWLAHVEDLWLDGRTSRARAVRIEVDAEHRPQVASGSGEEWAVEGFDLVLMRKDPPVDIDYLNALLVLEPAARHVPVINDPAGLRASNEKLLPLEVPGVVARQLGLGQRHQGVRQQERVLLGALGGHGVDLTEARSEPMGAVEHPARRRDRLPPLLREQVPIAASHLVSLMSHPLIDHPLVDPRGGGVRGERMAEDVEAADDRPL